MVLGGLTMMSTHGFNRKLCRTCAACDDEESCH